jgi:hypothetical protein
MVNANRISNERQHNDNMIAVTNAARLSDCHRQLVDNYDSVELQSSDYVTGQIELYRTLSAHLDPKERARWIKASIMSDKALSSLQTAILAGKLSVWRVHNAQEVSLTPLHLDKQNIQYGIYKSYQHPAPDMQGAYLWVKVSDWRTFLAAVTPQQTRFPGRPNQRNQALQLHETRLQDGTANSTVAKEARAIHSIMVERHKDDPDWSYAPESIAKALREHKKLNG